MDTQQRNHNAKPRTHQHRLEVAEEIGKHIFNFPFFSRYQNYMIIASTSTKIDFLGF